MRVAVVGGGPGGLYFSLLLRKARPDADVALIERNPAGATYGWGVVFSDRTLTSFREADYPTYERITDNFIIWDAIDVRYRDRIVRCGGQVFSGIARKKLLSILQDRCSELGVGIEFERELLDVAELDAYDLVVGADGVRSIVRASAAEAFRPHLSHGKARYIWFGTKRIFDSFTFAFRSNDHGFFQAHAYPFDGAMSTFIVECSEETWKRAGLDAADEDASIAYCESLFAGDLGRQGLISNGSKWANFVNLRNRKWHSGNLVLVGDSAHTAHFSIGSGTKLAMEDSIALVNALSTGADISSALGDYELERKPRVQRFQEAARQSQTYFESTSRYRHMEPLQFAFHLLSRSGRMDYDDLRVRDRGFVGSVDAWFAGKDLQEVAIAPPAAFTPLSLSACELVNRIAVAVPQTCNSDDGAPEEGLFASATATGAGLAFTDIVAVSERGRITRFDHGIYSEAQAEAWFGAVHRASEGSAAGFGITLGHAGPRASTRPRGTATDRPELGEHGWTPLAASSQRYQRGGLVAAEIDERRMDEVMGQYAAAAGRALAAGFDLLELHMGHGYLLGTFISPLTNRRTDGYGGSLESRLRYPLRVLDAVGKVWPEGKPLGVALSVSDWARGGISLNDAVAVARATRERGCDVVRVLAGQTVTPYRPRYDPYFLTHYSDVIRNEAAIATIATGDISTVDRANTIVAGGRADLCLLP